MMEGVDANERIGDAARGNTILVKDTSGSIQPNPPYEYNTPGVVDGPGATAIPLNGTDSLFNPFYVFRYSKFASIDGAKYSKELHLNPNSGISTAINEINEGANGPVKIARLDRQRIENPSATTIIDWAKANEIKGDSILNAAPYQLNDFLWCKWYGKIPNNRLLTLRRYPIPVEDNLEIKAESGPLTPLAQAVSWWGDGTSNSLSSILGMTYGFKWKPLSMSDIQMVTGNEVTADSFLSQAGVQDSAIARALVGTLMADEQSWLAASGLDKEFQKWAQEAYGGEGAYWNRILGPINVIDKTQIRDAGYDFTHPIKIDFTYKLRTFNNVNPKIAMLDLISNFLALTHNRAAFFGGGARYFARTGFTFSGALTNGGFESGDHIAGIQEMIKRAIASFEGKGEELKSFFGSLLTEADSLTDVATGLAGSNVGKTLLASYTKGLLNLPIKMRSFLDGRAVGEWHLTVGNPMDPIAVIGNLCLKSTSIKFSESLGLDDFPTEVTFTVSLEPGRPRAKQDIESMFNLGGGSMFYSSLAPPSTARNTYGEYNSQKLEEIQNGNKQEALSAEQSAANQQASFENQAQDTGQVSAEGAARLADVAASSVGRAYGARFAAAPVLKTYFNRLVTKD
jgi:hypothetical protein